MGEPAGAIQIGYLAVTSPDAVVDASTVRELEDLGAASLWAPGHVTIGRPVPEALTGLAALAALARRATVGTAVIVLPLYHPVVLAKQVAEIDRLAHGRVALGVGVGGEYPEEFHSCGVDISTRGARTDEAIEVLRSLWSAKPTTYQGAFFELDQISLEPPPSRPGGPPIIVAGRKAPAMRRAAANDGWMPFLYSPRQYRESVETIRSTAAAAGRNLDGFEWSCFVYVSIDDDPGEARARALRYVGAGQAGDGSRFEALIDRVAAVGDAPMVAARLQEYVDAGARHFVIAPCDRRGPLETATKVTSDVAPRLAGAPTLRGAP
jgi:probable F420-dependent oxidoreductase